MVEHRARLAEEERKRPPEHRPFIGPAAREQIRQQVAGELERHRQARRMTPHRFGPEGIA